MPKVDTSPVLEGLKTLRDGVGGEVQTVGLSDAVVARFIGDASLARAVADATDALGVLRRQDPAFVDLDEAEQVARSQAGIVNFYPDDGICPFVALAARGPWVITTKGRVVHDSGGYGMLGFGHGPDPILEVLGRPHVMANVMTPSHSAARFVAAMRAEVGHRREGGCPFAKLICLNSGSESVTVAARISDVNANLLTGPGGRHEGKPIKVVALDGAFHGRTDRPARFSDSCRVAYEKHLATFRDHTDLITVDPNDVDGLRAAFAKADADGFFIEAFFMEPVMGEGDPGMAMTPEFYAAARELTRAHGSMFLVDSIQAAIRAHGCLSIVDYPGFEKLDPPDMETYSKALNAGQYPLSVLAMTAETAKLYRKGIYGNTMTTAPRALEVACAVMELVTPELRENIRRRGREVVEKLTALMEELPKGTITKVQGTGLLFSVEMNPEFKCYGTGSTEEYMRLHGINVIHGGVNSLRYTPHFGLTEAEVDLLVDATRDALVNGPRYPK